MAVLSRRRPRVDLVCDLVSAMSLAAIGSFYLTSLVILLTR
jgi:hypothetical protein